MIKWSKLTIRKIIFIIIKYIFNRIKIILKTNKKNYAGKKISQIMEKTSVDLSP